MTIPGVGPIVSLAFTATIDIPARFKSSKAVGPALGLTLTRTIKWSWLKAWAMNIAKRRSKQRAIVALARRLAVIMHLIWSDGTKFRWTKESVGAAS
jgi:transposase